MTPPIDAVAVALLRLVRAVQPDRLHRPVAEMLRSDWISPNCMPSTKTVGFDGDDPRIVVLPRSLRKLPRSFCTTS